MSYILAGAAPKAAKAAPPWGVRMVSESYPICAWAMARHCRAISSQASTGPKGQKGAGVCAPNDSMRQV